MSILHRISLSAVKSDHPAEVYPFLCKLLRDGGVIAYPTETIYGLGCAAFNEAAVDRVRALKGIISERPFIILIPSFEWLTRLAVFGEKVRRLCSSFWPGPLTLVLEASETVPGFLLGEGRTIAVRHSPNVFVETLLRELDQPLVSTSANPQGYPPATSAEEVISYFTEHENTVDALVEDPGGMSGVASTVVSLVTGHIEVLREGSISENELRKIW
jgi:L-threonylcarbamoyladenylate synthase